MELSPQSSAGEGCPFIDLDDPHCRSHFTLGRLDAAFGDCFDGYRRCPNFYRLLNRYPQRLINITAHGRPLQPTGT